MADLVVELHGTRIGMLSGPWRAFDFTPDPAAVGKTSRCSTRYAREDRSSPQPGTS